MTSNTDNIEQMKFKVDDKSQLGSSEYVYLIKCISL